MRQHVSGAGAELPQIELDRLVALFKTGNYAELEQQANSLLGCYPDSGVAWKVLAISLQMQGKDALDALHKAAGLLPGDADISNSLGNALKGRGQFEEALACYRSALANKPSFAEVYYNLGCALEELGRYDEAAENLEHAVIIKPDFAGAHYNLGNCLQRMGRLDAAALSYRRVLDIAPDFAEAWSNFGVVLQDLGELDESLEGRYEEAAGCMRRAIAIKPDYAEAHYNLGNCLRKQGRLNDAILSYRHALEIDPGFSGAWCNLGVALKDVGELEEAIASCRRALALEPDSSDMYSNLLFTLSYYPELYEDEISAACREYDRRFGGGGGRLHTNDRTPERRLRIGYVSPDFRRHAVAYFVEPILANHDRTRVEVYCYAEVHGEDDYTERFQRIADHWHSTVGMSDEAVARMIVEHRIDILVDLAGHTRGNRLPVFGHKPAPVQMTYLGFSGSTGLTAMDYRITDRYADPEGEAESHYTEKLLRLPDSLWCYRPSPDMPEVTSLPTLNRGYLTFGSFNNFNKIDQDTVELWADLLRSIPDARLMILTAPEGEARLRLLKDFSMRGIRAQRLELHGAMPMDAFHRQFLKADIALDPVNVNGGTTTCEALWMGLPVISLTGRRFLSRAGLSLLSTVGMADFAAASPEAYVRVALYLNENRELLADLRAGLRGRVAGSPLADEAGFTRNLENVYRKIWRVWCETKTETDKHVSGKTKINSEDASSRKADSLVTKGASLSPEYFYRRAIELEEQGNLDEAVENYRRALEIRENLPEIHNDLANLLRTLGQFDAALAGYRRALEIAPDFAMAHANLGNLLKEMGQPDAALTSYRQALEIQPDYVMALVNMGSTLKDIGCLDEALATYQRVLEINPGLAVAHYNLADMLFESGRFDEAMVNCHCALDIEPEFAEAHNVFGNILKGQGHFDKAMASYRRALELRPDYVDAISNLGCALRESGQLEAAEINFRRALEIDPEFATGWLNLGVVQQELGLFDDALANYHHALKLDPGLAVAAYDNLLFTLNFHADKSGDEEIHAVCREYDRRFNLGDGVCHVNDRSQERRLRIGYVSPDFRRHAVAYFAEPILANHDRSQIEVFCYAEVAREDDYTERFRNLADHWCRTVGLSTEAVAQRIREDQIDVLVDLAGHTRGNRLPALGHKPAPVQMTYLGYPGTTGLTTVDYRLTDWYADPEGKSEDRYTEKLLRLPHSLWCYRPSPDMPEVTGFPAQQRGYLTFGSFNNCNKLDRDTLDLWAALLREIADSRLMVLTVPEGEARQRLLKEFAARGIGAQRLELHGSLPMDAFHRKFLEADIALDPVNVNGGTTTCEALWMGLPVLSLTGKRFLSRAGLSILSTVGMVDFAAATPEAYLQVASYLNENRDLLAEIRANLRGFVAASPLTDEVGFTRALEGVYRQVWREWCAAA